MPTIDEHVFAAAKYVSIQDHGSFEHCLDDATRFFDSLSVEQRHELRELLTRQMGGLTALKCVLVARLYADRSILRT